LEVTAQFEETLVELVISIFILSFPTSIFKDLFLKLYETLTEVRPTFLEVLLTLDMCISSSKGGCFVGIKSGEFSEHKYDDTLYIAKQNLMKFIEIIVRPD
jgi:hypothetical protein